MDAACLKCGRSSTFRSDSEEDRGLVAVKVFRCTRVQAHFLVFVLQASLEAEPPYSPWVMKIGQQPSLADLAQAEIGKYRKTLGEDLYGDFNRGIGLAAHGVGAGSFVYLRRVFEALILEAEKAMGIESSSRIDDRIQNASERLPPFLVKNKTLYGILSTGVHELAEEDCLEHFGVVRTGIELILDEKIEAAARAKKVADAEKEISRLNEKLSKRRTGGE